MNKQMFETLEAAADKFNAAHELDFPCISVTPCNFDGSCELEEATEVCVELEVYTYGDNEDFNTLQAFLDDCGLDYTDGHEITGSGDGTQIFGYSFSCPGYEYEEKAVDAGSDYFRGCLYKRAFAGSELGTLHVFIHGGNSDHELVLETNGDPFIITSLADTGLTVDEYRAALAEIAKAFPLFDLDFWQEIAK